MSFLQKPFIGYGFPVIVASLMPVDNNSPSANGYLWPGLSQFSFSGFGSEFNQGFISKENYKSWLKLKDNILWNQFCENILEKDGYWEISDVSSFTGLNIDFLKTLQLKGFFIVFF